MKRLEAIKEENGRFIWRVRLVKGGKTNPVQAMSGTDYATAHGALRAYRNFIERREEVREDLTRY